MWDKIRQIAINGKIYSNFRTIYDYVKCSVRHTDWFNVNAGLKQGCLLSPILFSLFVIDLTLALKGSGYSIDIDGTNVSVLQYADDIAIIAESEQQLQNMSRLVGKPTMWFPNRSDTNRPVQAQKRARSLKFWI